MRYQELRHWVASNYGCASAFEWVEREQVDARTAWETCPQADWMLWALRRLSASRVQIAQGLKACFEFTTKHWEVPEHLQPNYRRVLERLQSVLDTQGAFDAPTFEVDWGDTEVAWDARCFLRALTQTNYWVSEGAGSVDRVAHHLSVILQLSSTTAPFSAQLPQIIRDTVSFEQALTLLRGAP